MQKSMESSKMSAWHSLRSKAIGAWNFLQVETHGHYSSERLVSLQHYSSRAGNLELLALVLLTPIPSLLSVVLADVIPLNPPEAGTNSNIIFWLRAYFIVWIFTLSFVVQFREMLPALPMSCIRSFGITIFVSNGVILYCYGLSLEIGFPVPFLMVAGSPVWGALLLGSFALSWSYRVRRSSTLQTQAMNSLMIFIIQVSMIVIYPLYLHVFSNLSPLDQAWFSLLLIIIKMAIKNGICRCVQHNTDMQPEIVIFNVEVFNALFVSFSMQNATSKFTIAVIVAVDFIRMALSFYEVMVLLRGLRNVEDQLILLRNLVRICPQSPRKSTSALAQACRIVTDNKRARCIDKKNMWRQSTKKVRAKRLRPLSRPGKVHPQRSPEKRQIAHAWAKSSEDHRAAECTNVDGKHCKRISHGVPANLQSSLVFLELLYVRKVSSLLHLVEFTVLVEYTEVIVPVVYSSYVIAMSYLPNHVYYPQLASMDEEKLTSTLSNVLLYGLLEFISLFALTVILQKTVRYSLIHQLAFVLRTQWKMVQSKLILWVVYVVQTSLVHFGSDYTFRFSWLKKNPENI